MEEQLIFVIGPPRSGSTMLQRMLGSHSKIHTHPEPHIITPLAHLGYFYNVDKAPFDHINAAEAIREYVEDLPAGQADYLDACRAYTDLLYGRLLQTTDKTMLLDKTPAYGLVLPFLTLLYPKAKYIVLTRHPLAVLSSYASSFFEGDYRAAVSFNNILGRYIPAIASFLREQSIPRHHIQYEHLVENPEARMAEIFDFLGLPNEEGAVNYGDHKHVEKSYGDPKVSQESRPTTKSVSKWAKELASDKEKLEIARNIVKPIAAEDIAIWGYDKETLFDKIAEAGGKPPKRDARWATNSYRLRRKIFMTLRKDIHTKPLGKALRRIRYYCDVLLRE